MPLSGKLTDIFGRRSGLLFSCLAFITGNLICALAQSKLAIIVGRAVAGIGGGGLNSISTFVASDLIPLRRRGLWQGLGMIVFTSGAALGSVIGGLITDKVGWRYAFLGLCPLTFIATIGVYYTVSSTALIKDEASFMTRLHKIDFLGSFFLIATLCILLFGLDYVAPHSLSSSKPSAPPTTLYITLPLSALSFILFLLIEARYSTEPIIPLSIFKSRTVFFSCTSSFFISMTFFSLQFYIPLFFQTRGTSVSRTGLLLLPQALGAALGGFLTGYILRVTGHYTYMKPILLIICLSGAGCFSVITFNSPNWIPEIFLFLNGFGFGGFLTILLISLLSALPYSMQAVATSVMYAFRTVGSTLGISLSSMIFRAILQQELNDEPIDGVPSKVRLPRGGCKKQGMTDTVKCDAYGKALRSVFLFALGLTGVAMVCGMLVKNYKLRSSFAKEPEQEADENDHAHVPEDN